MFGECHAHMLMDGVSYKAAVARHRTTPDEAFIRHVLHAYKQAGVTFIRDGGDHLGVSSLAAKIAPEYGIDYRTPAFAIYKNGHYGAVVGKGFDTLGEYATLVKEAKAQNADFIKIMTSGIMDFDKAGQLTSPGLPALEVTEMVHIAHSEGLSVMVHVNGAANVKIALEASADSIEHGNFMDDECLSLLTETHIIWVPTVAITGNIIGSGRYNDTVLSALHQRQMQTIKKALTLGAAVALGSDAGAYCVPHPRGIFDEYHYIKKACPNNINPDPALTAAEHQIKTLFKPWL
ncbi:MAG: Xaa-Pro dipeptidase [Eubacterium sp.]